MYEKNNKLQFIGWINIAEYKLLKKEYNKIRIYIFKL